MTKHPIDIEIMKELHILMHKFFVEKEFSYADAIEFYCTNLITLLIKASVSTNEADRIFQKCKKDFRLLLRQQQEPKFK